MYRVTRLASANVLPVPALASSTVVDRAAGTVSCSAAVRYGALAETLTAEGLALRNLASLPHISIGGAIANCPESERAGRGMATALATCSP